jgi:hypothetical protein
MIAERSTYQGNKMIVLKKHENDKYPFSFGLAKAKLVVEGIEEIKKFIQEQEGGSNTQTTTTQPKTKNNTPSSEDLDLDNMPF